METIRQFAKDAQGAQMVEYALLIAFIGLMLITVLTGLSGAVGGVFTRAGAGFSP